MTEEKVTQDEGEMQVVEVDILEKDATTVERWDICRTCVGNPVEALKDKGLQEMEEEEAAVGPALPFLAWMGQQ